MSDNTTPPDALAAVRERLVDLDRQIAVLEARRDEARGLLELLSQTTRRKPGPKPGWKQQNDAQAMAAQTTPEIMTDVGQI